MKISILAIAPLLLTVAQAALVKPVGGQENYRLERRQRGGPPRRFDDRLPAPGPRGRPTLPSTPFFAAREPEGRRLRRRVLNTNGSRPDRPGRDGEIIRSPEPEFDRGTLAPPPGGKQKRPTELEALRPVPKNFGIPRGGSKDSDKKLPLPPPPMHIPPKGVPPPRQLQERQLPPNGGPKDLPVIPVVPPAKIGGRPPPLPQHAALRPPPPGPMPKLPPPPGRRVV
ncbi:hypothetical protein TWF730_001936 [Orbilia blumenaviensis]|uniref:Uncharacterized protein n=1 Tax=Orbilia blumenaviensis TaxID=1796055 RepID=A0AAV9UCH7_9PEZI